jgi:hypothetical protein
MILKKININDIIDIIIVGCSCVYFSIRGEKAIRAAHAKATHIVFDFQNDFSKSIFPYFFSKEV